MRNVKYIIQEARDNTNTLDSQAISVRLCTNLLNRSLNHLCNMLYNKNVRSLLFRKTFEIPVTSESREYDLPFDAFAETGVINVFYSGTDGYSRFVPRIADKNRSNKFGYVLLPKKIYINRSSYVPDVLTVTYSARPPLFGLVAGTIDSLVDNTSITLRTGFLEIEEYLGAGFLEIEEYDEFYCIVDLDGNIIKRGVKVSQVGPVLYLDDTSDVLAGMKVVIGKYSTTHCPLSSELEPSLLSMLEFMINARLSSKDVPISDAISTTTVDELTELFTDPSADEMTPPELEYKEWL